MAEPATLYKLIILHMLEHIDFPLSNAQISDFFLDREYTDYFTIQQVIHDLMDSGLVRTENTHNSTRYIITPAGKETLHFFMTKYPLLLKKILLLIFRQISLPLKQKMHIYPIITKHRNRNTVCDASSGKKAVPALILL